MIGLWRVWVIRHSATPPPSSESGSPADGRGGEGAVFRGGGGGGGDTHRLPFTLIQTPSVTVLTSTLTNTAGQYSKTHTHTPTHTRTHPQARPCSLLPANHGLTHPRRRLDVETRPPSLHHPRPRRPLPTLLHIHLCSSDGEQRLHIPVITGSPLLLVLEEKHHHPFILAPLVQSPSLPVQHLILHPFHLPGCQEESEIHRRSRRRCGPFKFQSCGPNEPAEERHRRLGTRARSD